MINRAKFKKITLSTGEKAYVLRKPIKRNPKKVKKSRERNEREG